MLVDLHKVSSRGGNSSTSFHVFQLDNLFSGAWHEERLAFAHFDVEGAELDLLMGADMVIQRDQPVFTVEVDVNDRPTLRRMLEKVEILGYQARIVPEVCGLNP